MKAIDQLRDGHLLALGRFIAGCQRARGTSHWRTCFSRCAVEDNFFPFVNYQDQDRLRNMLGRFNAGVVCRLRTRDVLSAANEVAQAWGEPRIAL